MEQLTKLLYSNIVNYDFDAKKTFHIGSYKKLIL